MSLPMLIASKYLNDQAQASMLNVSSDYIRMGKNGEVYKAATLSTEVRTDNLDKGVQAISEVINDLASQSLIDSVLTNISTYSMRRSLQAPSEIVYANILIPLETHKYLSEKYPRIYTVEGMTTVPLADDELFLDLKEGEFMHTISISHALFLQLQNPNRFVQSRIDLILMMLPADTIVLETVEIANPASLVKTYDVKFFNPILKKVKFIEFDLHHITESVDGQMRQAGLIKNFRYLDYNRKEVF